MQRSKIPWTDYSINPVKGLCPVGCSYCYARRLHKRFKWDETIRYDPEAFKGLPSKPSRIFVGSTMELFGEWVERDWLHMIFTKVLARSQHTFIFLTKQPEDLIKWSPFPDNCWVGVSICNTQMFIPSLQSLLKINARCKFISFEPLLERINTYASISGYLKDAGINWVIIGSQTQPVKHPNPGWVKEIIDAADMTHIPVFVKEPLASHIGIQRQEYPKELEV